MWGFCTKCSNKPQQLIDSASVASSVQITNEGLNILNSSNNKISEFGVMYSLDYKMLNM